MRRILTILLTLFVVSFASGQIDLDQSFPTSQDSLVLEGIKLIDNNEFKKASKIISKAIKKDIINPAGSYYLGIALNNSWRSNHPKQDKAINAFTNAIEHDINNPKYFFRRGLCYHGKGDHRLALVDFDRAITLNPDIPEYYYFRATARLSLLPYDSDSTLNACLALKDLNSFNSISNNLDSTNFKIIEDLIGWGFYHQIIAYQVLGDSSELIKIKSKLGLVNTSLTHNYNLSYGWPQYFSGKRTGREPATVVFPVGVHPFDFRVKIRKKHTCNNG